MERLSQVLVRHPVAVMLMFLVSMLSGAMTIVLGWTQFYSSYLSRSVELPVWFLGLLGFLASTLYLWRPARRPLIKKEETVEGKEFHVQQVPLDGVRYVNCTFDGTELVYKGLGSFSLEKNHFKGPPRILFEGAAGATVHSLKVLIGDPGFRPYVLALLGEKPH